MDYSILKKIIEEQKKQLVNNRLPVSHFIIMKSDNSRKSADLNLSKKYFADPMYYNEVCLSSFITQNKFFPNIDQIFSNLKAKISEVNQNNKVAYIKGFDAILTICSVEIVRKSYSIIQKMLEDTQLCFILETYIPNPFIDKIFNHPRLKESNRILNFNNSSIDRRLDLGGVLKIRFLHKKYRELVNGVVINSIQEFFREYENDSIEDNKEYYVLIDANSPIASISKNIPQIYSHDFFFKEFFHISDQLSPDIYDDFYRKVKDYFSNKEQCFDMFQILKSYFFEDSYSNEKCQKNILLMIQALSDIECDELIWLLRNIFYLDSYLKTVLQNPELNKSNFSNYYVCQALTLLDAHNVEEYAAERQQAIANANINNLFGDIAEFISQSKRYAFESVGPWLNNETEQEHIEIITRIVNSPEGCDINGMVNIVSKGYELLNAYIQPYEFQNDVICEYFQKYRELKLRNAVTEEFVKTVSDISYPPDNNLKNRHDLLNQYYSDEDYALLVIDALGVEYLPMIIYLAEKNKLAIKYSSPCYVNLPTSTKFNLISWPDSRKIKGIKGLDNIIHSGAESHEINEFEKNFVKQLNFFQNTLMPKIFDSLKQYKYLILTADHGASRLAVRAYEEKMIKTINLAEKDREDWRYVPVVHGKSVPSEAVSSMDNKYWVIKGYDRFSQKGGKLNELHGGLTYEEVLVPFIVIGDTRSFSANVVSSVPIEQSTEEFIENDDFDF